jgi:hypothetical protein
MDPRLREDDSRGWRHGGEDSLLRDCVPTLRFAPTGPQGRPGDIHFVMPGLVPGIPILIALRFPMRDGRD